MTDILDGGMKHKLKCPFSKVALIILGIILLLGIGLQFTEFGGWSVIIFAFASLTAHLLVRVFKFDSNRNQVAFVIFIAFFSIAYILYESLITEKINLIRGFIFYIVVMVVWSVIEYIYLKIT